MQKRHTKFLEVIKRTVVKGNRWKSEKSKGEIKSKAIDFVGKPFQERFKIFDIISRSVFYLKYDHVLSPSSGGNY
jgi:hypothetical protein